MLSAVLKACVLALLLTSFCVVHIVSSAFGIISSPCFSGALLDCRIEGCFCGTFRQNPQCTAKGYGCSIEEYNRNGGYDYALYALDLAGKLSNVGLASAVISMVCAGRLLYTTNLLSALVNQTMPMIGTLVISGGEAVISIVLMYFSLPDNEELVIAKFFYSCAIVYVSWATLMLWVVGEIKHMNTGSVAGA
jgi:hypothetical protein